jgi:hypothetical protein
MHYRFIPQRLTTTLIVFKRHENYSRICEYSSILKQTTDLFHNAHINKATSYPACGFILSVNASLVEFHEAQNSVSYALAS